MFHRQIVALREAVRFLILSDDGPHHRSEYAIRLAIIKSRGDQGLLNLRELLRRRLGLGKSITAQFRSILRSALFIGANDTCLLLTRKGGCTQSALLRERCVPFVLVLPES